MAVSFSMPAVGGLRALLEPKRAIRHFLRIAMKMTGASCGSFILLNPNTGLLDIEASYGISLRARKVKLQLGEGITGWVATSGQAMRIPDVRQERKYVSINSKVRSELAVPVERDGRILGIINLDSNEIDHFSEEHQDQMMGLAMEAAEWLSHGWELLNLRGRDQQLHTLVQMGRTIGSQTNLDDALAGIVRNGARLMKSEVCSLMLLSTDSRELVIRSSCGTSPRYQNRPPLKVDESLVGVVARRMRPVTVLNVQTDPRYHEIEMARRENLVSLLSVPLVFSARPVGVLNVYTREPHRFSNEEIKLLQTLADLSAVAIEKSRLLTRVVDTEETLRQSERLSALGLLAAEVAHEIRNPLTVMQMLFHSLVSSTTMEGPARKDAEIIEEKMKQMNRIVDQILSLVRSAEPIKEPIAVSQLIDDIILLVRHKLYRQGIEIRRPGPVGTGHSQPDSQRRRGDAGGGNPLAGRQLGEISRCDADHPASPRQRHRHDQSSGGKPFRPLPHHQAAGDRHRLGAGAAHPGKSQRQDRDRIPSPAWNQDPPAAAGQRGLATASQAGLRLGSSGRGCVGGSGGRRRCRRRGGIHRG